MYDAQQLANLLGFGETEVVSMLPKVSEPTPMQYLSQLSEDTGYQMHTDYAQRLADAVEDGTLKNRYAELLCEAEKDYRNLTELVMILNWLGWYYNEIRQYAKSQEILKWWEDADNYAFDTLKGEELDYFIQTLD